MSILSYYFKDMYYFFISIFTTFATSFGLYYRTDTSMIL